MTAPGADPFLGVIRRHRYDGITNGEAEDRKPTGTFKGFEITR